MSYLSSRWLSLNSSQSWQVKVTAVASLLLAFSIASVVVAQEELTTGDSAGTVTDNDQDGTERSRGDSVPDQTNIQESSNRNDNEWVTPQVFRFGTRGSIRVVTGRWAGIGLDLINPNDEEAFVESTSFVEAVPHREFSRSFWIPPRSRRSGWYPIYIPPTAENSQQSLQMISPKTNQITLKSWFVDRSGGRDEPIPRDTGELQFADQLVLDHMRPRTGIINESDVSHNEFRPAYEALIALMQEAGRERLTYDFVPSMYPPTPLLLDAFEVMLVAGDDLTRDSMAVEAMRQWVVGGGHLWIMLDRTPEKLAAQLCGEAWGVEVVDETSLVDIDFEVLQEGATVTPTFNRQLETPVKMVRCLPSESQPKITVNGWPALFWLELGRGRIMVTTIEADAWVVPRPPARRSADRNVDTDYVVIDSLRREAAQLYGTNELTSFPKPSLNTYASEQVGYRVPTNVTMSFLLGGFVVILLVVGLLARKTETIKRLAWVMPAAAAVLSIGLVGYARINRAIVPRTVIDAQFVQVSPRTDEFFVEGTTAVYSPSLETVTIDSSDGTSLLLDNDSSESLQIRWTDVGKSKQEARIGPGVTSFEYEARLRRREPWRAEAHFEGGELVGTLAVEQGRQITDLLLGNQRGLMLGRSDEPGTFRVSTLDLVYDQQFFGSAVLDRERQRRRAIYWEVLGNRTDWGQLRRPKLFFWSQGLVHGLKFPNAERYVTNALFAVPVDIVPPPVGTPVKLSTPWFEMRTLTRDGGLTPLYSERQREWVERDKPLDALLAFRPPDSVLPWDLQKVQLDFDLRVERRPLKIYLLNRQGEEHVIYTGQGYTGPLKLVVDDPAQLAMSDDGEFLIGISVGEKLNAEETMNDWQILDVDLVLDGQVAPSNIE